MTTPARTNTAAGTTSNSAVPERGTTHLSGWVVFSAIALITGGVMRFFDAIWAFRYHGTVPQNLEDALFGHSLKTYGWIWLVVAAILVVSGVMLFSGSQIARWVGIAAGSVAAISAIWWIPYYPVWSLAYMGIGFAIILGLATYGGRDSM